MNISEKDNQTLIDFWNQALTMSEENKEELKQYGESDWIELVPSGKLFDAVKALSDKKKVLDKKSVLR